MKSGFYTVRRRSTGEVIAAWVWINAPAGWNANLTYEFMGI
jgi:hypothetical protein